jgi:hypothetical protein
MRHPLVSWKKLPLPTPSRHSHLSLSSPSADVHTLPFLLPQARRSSSPRQPWRPPPWRSLPAGEQPAHLFFLPGLHSKAARSSAPPLPWMSPSLPWRDAVLLQPVPPSPTRPPPSLRSPWLSGPAQRSLSLAPARRAVFPGPNSSSGPPSPMDDLHGGRAPLPSSLCSFSLTQQLCMPLPWRLFPRPAVIHFSLGAGELLSAAATSMAASPPWPPYL